MSKEQLIGTWRLVSYEKRAGDGSITHPIGERPVGRLQYDERGNMAVQMMKVQRPAFVSGDRLNASIDEIKAAFDGYSAYFGTYEVVPKRTLSFII